MKYRLLLAGAFCAILATTGCGPAMSINTPTIPAPTVTSTFTPVPTLAPPSVEITAQHLRVVQERDFYSTIIKDAGRGTQAAVLDVYREGDYVWVYVQFADDRNRKGWIFTKYSTDNPDVKFNQTAINLITAANINPTSTPIPDLLDVLPPSIFPPLPPPECPPTDQDQYVYQPGRLITYAACIHVTGVVKEVFDIKDGDGDTTFDVALDAPYQHFINMASRNYRNGYMHVEIICSVPISPIGERAAVEACSKDPDPLQPPYPKVGDHVWLEGRFVTDGNSQLWVELHPLYRWGLSTK
jgi:hypothetical protein